MAVNNETGVIQPIYEIADAITKASEGKRRPKFHVDCVQAAGKISLNLSYLSLGGVNQLHLQGGISVNHRGLLRQGEVFPGPQTGQRLLGRDHRVAADGGERGGQHRLFFCVVRCAGQPEAGHAVQPSLLGEKQDRLLKAVGEQAQSRVLPPGHQQHGLVAAEGGEGGIAGSQQSARGIKAEERLDPMAAKVFLAVFAVEIAGVVPAANQNQHAVAVVRHLHRGLAVSEAGQIAHRLVGVFALGDRQAGQLRQRLGVGKQGLLPGGRSGSVCGNGAVGVDRQALGHALLQQGAGNGKLRVGVQKVLFPGLRFPALAHAQQGQLPGVRGLRADGRVNLVGGSSMGQGAQSEGS